MSRHSVSFKIRKMLIKITLKYHFSPMRLAKIFKLNTILFWAKLWEMKHFHT